MSTYDRTNIEDGIYLTRQGRFCVRIQSPKAKQRTLPAGADLAQARIELARLRAEASGRPMPLGGDDSTATLSLLDYSEAWIEAYALRTRPRVAMVAMAALRDHILPEIGHIAVDELTPEDVVAMTKAWVEKSQPDGTPYAKDTIGSWWRTAKAFIADACAQRRIAFVPTTRVKLPRMRRAKRREQRTLTPRQLVQLLDWAQKHEPRRYAEVSLFALGGFRPGEVYALTWDRVDFETRTITITESVDHGHLDAPKTARDEVIAHRIQVVPQRGVDALREHRKWMMSGKRQVKQRREGEQTRPIVPNLVLPSDYDTHRSPSGLTKTWNRASRALRFGIGLGPQVLRRTYNTIMKDHADRATLHAMIGHVDEEMTELYSHVSYEAKAAAVARFEAVLNSGAQ